MNMVHKTAAWPRKKHSRTRDWAALPLHLLDLILDHVISLGDFLRFGCVCWEWILVTHEPRNHRRLPAAAATPGKFSRHQLPMLMFRSHMDGKISRLYSPTKESVLQHRARPLTYRGRFMGSSFGWLILVEINFEVRLINPFMDIGRSIILLPPVITAEMLSSEGQFDFHVVTNFATEFNPDYYFVKGILSADPFCSRDTYIVMLIYGRYNRLACIRPGCHPGLAFKPQYEASKSRENWVYLDPALQEILDIVCLDGLFYALNSSGEVFTINIDTKNQVTITKISPPLATAADGACPCYARYIVESCVGDLLQVLRFGEERDAAVFPTAHKTTKFQVLKLHKVSSVSKSSWVELKSLGNEALFVGDNSSLSVLASNFPGVHPGSIYYTFGFGKEHLIRVRKEEQPNNRNPPEPGDMAIFNLESGQFRSLSFQYDHFTLEIHAPIWVVPTYTGMVLVSRGP